MTAQVAWFVCRYGKIADDIALPLKDGVLMDDATLAKQGRMRAARHFKRLHGLHPCTKIETEFQGVLPTIEYAAA